jgi:hypothetical protein
MSASLRETEENLGKHLRRGAAEAFFVHDAEVVF